MLGRWESLRGRPKPLNLHSEKNTGSVVAEQKEYRVEPIHQVVACSTLPDSVLWFCQKSMNLLRRPLGANLQRDIQTGQSGTRAIFKIVSYDVFPG